MIPDAVFTLQRAKAHLRVPHSDEDALIMTYLDAAVAACERFTRRAWTKRTWSVLVDACDLAPCGCDDSAVFHALLSPATVKVYNTPPPPGAEAQLPAGDVFVSQRFGHSIVNVKTWTPTHATDGVVGRIDFSAGPPGDLVPADVVSAALLYLGDLYANREAQIVGTVIAQNALAEVILRPYVLELHA